MATIRVPGDSRRIWWMSHSLVSRTSIAITCGCALSTTGSASFTVATLAETTKGGTDKPLASASRYTRTGAMTTSESGGAAWRVITSGDDYRTGPGLNPAQPNVSVQPSASDGQQQTRM